MVQQGLEQPASQTFAHWHAAAAACGAETAPDQCFVKDWNRSPLQASTAFQHQYVLLPASLPACVLVAAPLYADRAAIVNGEKEVALPEGETAAADEPGAWWQRTLHAALNTHNTVCYSASQQQLHACLLMRGVAQHRVCMQLEQHTSACW
jgi:hypothetical protein